MKRLTGKVALVSGAGAGIGAAICKRFSAEGAAIVALERNPDTLAQLAVEIEETGGAVLAVEGDVTRRADCAAAAAQAFSAHGAIDVLCNVAGIVEGGDLEAADEESWERTMAVNLKGMFFLSQEVVPRMAERGSGSIVNIASVAGPYAVRERFVYSVSKSGVIGFTKSLAVDYIARGLRANAICPGTVETPSWHERVNEADDPDQALKDFIARQPMGRVGQPEEIAALAAYLAADESSFMTGQAINIDGGMSM